MPTMSVSRPHPIPEFDLPAPLKFTDKWDEDLEGSVYIVTLIDTLERFLKIKLFYRAVKISSKKSYQNIMSPILVYP